MADMNVKNKNYGNCNKCSRRIRKPDTHDYCSKCRWAGVKNGKDNFKWITETEGNTWGRKGGKNRLIIALRELGGKAGYKELLDYYNSKDKFGMSKYEYGGIVKSNDVIIRDGDYVRVGGIG